MRNLMIPVLAVFSFNVALTAQVKDQFRDRENSSTIVVVKEDNAIDQNLLNEHFDLADMSMSDQIMIMTVPDKSPTPPAPDMENATASADETNIEEFFDNIDTDEELEAEDISNTSTAEIPMEVKETTIDKTVVVESKPVAVKSNSRVSSTRARGTYTVKNTADVKQAARKKYFSKKKKKKSKNKRSFFGKKRSNSCYSF